MPTQLHDLELTLWPLLIKWRLMDIARNSAPQLPNSWLKIFQSIELSNCSLLINSGWFRINADLQCKEIDVLHLPLRWFPVANLNSAFSKDFYFVHSDFRNLEGKQVWWNMTVKADNLIKNGKIGPAIKDTTISGIAFDVLKTVTMISDEMVWSSGGMCGKKQLIPVGMGGPAIKCKLNIGGR